MRHQLKRAAAILAAVMLATGLIGCASEMEAAKPVIYLYPERASEVLVQLEYEGKLTATWPEYQDGWQVMAYPDGTLHDAEGNQYSYLFWEGKSDIEYDFSKGFCVAGEDTADFLRETLAEIGLTPREYNEFIVYWLPKMQDNPYNLISFQAGCYTEAAKLEITPEPDSVLRVFMAWKPLQLPQQIEPQTFESFARTGFTVVEWGGCQVS